MLIVLSPAKTMRNDVPENFSEKTLPQHLDKAARLVKELKALSVSELSQVMKMSPSLARSNFMRFRQWDVEKHKNNGVPALLSYQGEVFRGLQAGDFDRDDFLFAAKHLRILSGLYGVLRPEDAVLPYRVEMGGLFAPAGFDNLYQYWKETITRNIEQVLSGQPDRTLVNLASQEYYKSIDVKKLNSVVITPVFKEARGDGYKMVTVYAKKARGLMARFVIKNRITNPEDLKFFESEGYYYNERISQGEEMVFTR